MNIEEKIKDCEYNLKQINYFNPDPFYVNYFFKAYLLSAIDIYDKNALATTAAQKQAGS